MTHLRRFCRFWYDFVVGDDRTVAIGVVAALGATWFATHHGAQLVLALACGRRRPARAVPSSGQPKAVTMAAELRVRVA